MRQLLLWIIFSLIYAPAVLFAQSALPNELPSGPARPGFEAVRIDRLEKRLRELTGELETLRFQLMKLEEQMRRLQAALASTLNLPLKDNQDKQTPKVPPKNSNEASDKNQPSPSSPGPIPKNLPDSSPAEEASGSSSAPLTLGSAYQKTDPAPPSSESPKSRTTAASDTSKVISPPTGEDPEDLSEEELKTADGTILATPKGPDIEYRFALNFFYQSHYDTAASAFRNFIKKYPQHQRMDYATYYLGQSYAHLSRPRDAAEQFLILVRDYPQSHKAPGGLLGLGLALQLLGKKKDACAAFQNLPLKYPNAPESVRKTAEQELKRHKCS